ncbi:MAG: TRAP transporter small permease subunit [Acetobacteraceae bacterium]|nr:TRAP transporter small permease subunit [Acetobacteraceae bacterium]
MEFATGTVWTQDREWHLMSTIALIGMSFSLLRVERLRVNVLFARFGPRIQAAIDLLAAAPLIAIALFVVELSWAYVAQSRQVNEGSANPGGPHTVWR